MNELKVQFKWYTYIKKKNKTKPENTFFLNIPGTFTTGDMY